MIPITGTMTGYPIHIVTPERFFTPEQAVRHVMPAEGGVR